MAISIRPPHRSYCPLQLRVRRRAACGFPHHDKKSRGTWLPNVGNFGSRQKMFFKQHLLKEPNNPLSP